jgi:protein ImuB
MSGTDGLRQLHALAHWAYQFTPSVSLHTPADGQAAGLLLEVAPSLTLFGGLAALCTRIETGITGLGHIAHMGVSLTATSAWWLSRHRCEQAIRITESSSLLSLLPSLPVQVLDQAKAHAQTWANCGIHRIADLLQLPRSGLARRFGSHLLTELDCGFGQQAETHCWIQPPAVFSLQAEMPFHTHSLQGVLACTAPLVNALCLWLAGQRAATRCLSFEFRHSREHRTPRAVRSAQPQASPAAWLQLVQDDLTREPLLAEVTDICLTVRDIQALADHSGVLFPGMAEQNQAWEQLLTRLHARLGDAQVQSISSHADARPEKSHRAQPFASTTHRKAPLPRQTPCALRLPRPLWFFAEPVRLLLDHQRQQTVERNLRNGSANTQATHAARATHPAHPAQAAYPVLYARQSALKLLAGPERIEFGWWDQAVKRDYFIAQDSDYRQLWIFREEDQAGLPARWYVQGLFA